MALFLTTEWIAQGIPPRIRLVELGPGRGTLMDDILRVGLTSGRSAVLSIPQSQADRTDVPFPFDWYSRRSPLSRLIHPLYPDWNRSA